MARCRAASHVRWPVVPAVMIAERDSEVRIVRLSVVSDRDGEELWSSSSGGAV